MARFVIHLHDAIKRGKHYDLRFQIPNSSNWASFATTKELPKQPGESLYIVRANDHSEKEALFTGTIPEGEYGAGTLKVWDSGSCTISKYSPYHIIIDFHGSKLKGIYQFLNVGIFGGKQSYKKKVWKFFKSKVGD
jgi:bifunctional non-homologous end joining protein LigD